MNDLALIFLSSIVTFLVTSYYVRKESYIDGYKKGLEDERLFISVAVGNAFKDDREGAAKKVTAAYKQLLLELQQEAQVAGMSKK